MVDNASIDDILPPANNGCNSNYGADGKYYLIEKIKEILSDYPDLTIEEKDQYDHLKSFSFDKLQTIYHNLIRQKETPRKNYATAIFKPVLQTVESFSNAKGFTERVTNDKELMNDIKHEFGQTLKWIPSSVHIVARLGNHFYQSITDNARTQFLCEERNKLAGASESSMSDVNHGSM
jgi:hypothetical protein